MIYVNILIEYWHQYMSISRGGRFININILLIFIRWTIFGYWCIVDTTHNIEILSFNMGCLIYRSPLVTIQLLGFVIFFMLKDFFLIATHYTWHVTCNTWHVTYGGQWTFSQNFSSLDLTVWDLWCCEYLEEKDRLLVRSISDEAVCRTAPATPGVLIK